MLARWITAVAAPARDQEPWLDYWLGVSCIAYNTIEARQHLERAHSSFDATLNRTGMLLSWAGIVETLILEFNDLTRLEPWIEWLTNDLLRTPEFPSVAVELHVVSSMALVILFRRDESSVVRPWIERATAAITLIPDLGIRCRLATGHSGIDVQYALYCQTLHEWTAGIGDFGRSASSAALAHAANSGIHAIEHHLVARGLTERLCLGDLAAAQESLQQLQTLADKKQTSRLLIFQYHNLPGWLSLIAGNHQQALNEARDSLQLSQSSGAPIFHRCCSHIVAGYALVFMRRFVEAQPHIDNTLTLARGFESPFLEFSALMLQAFAEQIHAAVDNRTEDLTTLPQALALGQQHNFFNTAIWLPATVAPLCCVALEQKIEQHYVQQLIIQRHLEPAAPPVHLENWSWPLRIYTLGRFSITHDSQPLQLTRGKGHKKPVELFQVLIALGGRQIGVEHLIEQLWPDAEGDAGANLFKITLHRLRKLLGHEHAIEYAEGRLSLNARTVWVDSWSLARLLSPSATADMVNRGRSLYRGHFLEFEPATNTAIPHHREQLKGRLLRTLKSSIESCEKQQDWATVVSHGEYALSMDDVDEDFYSATIRAHQARGRHAEALRIFDQAKLRYAQLNLHPSSQLQALIRQSH